MYKFALFVRHLFDSQIEKLSLQLAAKSACRKKAINKPLQ